MPLALFNSITSWFLRRRIDQIQQFVNNPHQTQERVLAELLNAAKDTEIGKKYGFSEIENYQQFVQNTPLVTYEEFEPYIDRARKGERNVLWHSPIKWFAKSSGTTNAKSKFIPVSEEALQDCHYKSGKDMLCLYLNNNENSNLFTGKSLRLGGSKELYQENGTYFGDLSAILIENLPFWAEFSSTPSNKVSLMSEWETKLQAIVKEAKNANVTSMAGVPSWMLVLLNRVLEETGKNNLLEIWKNLEVYFHGGVSFVPYREQYKKIIPSDTFRYYEIYNASEGFFGIQDRNNSDELLLMLDYGVFYEFIPMDTFGTNQQKVIPLSEVELGKNYAMVITTNAGLWRYIIGDTIRFTSVSPYRIKITGRTKHFINVFGEELIIENTEKGLKKACELTNSHVKDYTVAPIFMKDKLKGGHEWIIEFDKEPLNIEKFTEILDEELKKVNSDYEAKRYNNMTLNMPTVHVARQNLFHDWLKNKGKLGGQNKVPRLSNSREHLEELLKFM
ncbi:GH3 auxin-responsive promoter family protein [Capnocytophaga canis]|uniref:GH3 auxin-responsive promoter n=1 Tax=Capnocytophaga canis TaxID=1848903 RepID=A0A0B7IDD1_9FLAO|nr:GH3 auxin-responsive promoter family protein [Capnocytophaga canis]CEN49730.1 GH3 auxin-responsive promoter [Capnocytophaga canis]